MAQREDVEFRLRYQLDQSQREAGGLRMALIHILQERRVTPELRKKAYLALNNGEKIVAGEQK
jgi:hypothetical protein